MGQRSRAALQRYLFYCNRYMNHMQSLRFEHKLYAQVKQKMEERELEKSQELDDLDLALLFQMLLQHFCVPRIILGAIGNRWGTKGLNFLLHEVFRCLHLGRPVLRASAVGLQ